MSDDPLVFGLLPRHYRDRDASGAGALRALATVLDEARAAVEDDIAGLYRDWFVETCDERLLPLIGHLVGQADFEGDARALRTVVADTVAFRRRKGGVAATEKRLAALTGWPVRLIPDAASGTVEVRVWREEVFPIAGAEPRPATGEGARPGCYHFDPFGRDVPLFAVPRPDPGIDAPFVEALDAPLPLDRGSSPDAVARSIVVHLAGRPLPPEAVAFGDLGTWRIPAPGAGDAPLRAIVDPALGRLALVQTADLGAGLAVDYAYGAPAGLGGGPSERAMTVPATEAWMAYVHAAAAPAAALERTPAFPTLRAALAAFDAVPGPGLIRILDSRRQDVDGVTVGAAPTGCPPDPDAPRHLVVEALSGEVPCLAGTVTVRGGGPGLHLVLRGLWIDGTLALDGDVAAELRDCTVHPVTAERAAGRAVPAVVCRTASVRLAARDCLVGALDCAADAVVTVSDSVIDGTRGGQAIAGRAAGHLVRTSVIGGAALERLQAADCIFDGRMVVADVGLGEVRTSFVSAGSVVPPAIDSVVAGPTVRPAWVSLTPGQPGYARLGPDMDLRIRTGGSGGHEMGAHHRLEVAKREGLLLKGLEAYLPVGVTARVVEG